jgi:hypothetical protein
VGKRLLAGVVLLTSLVVLSAPGAAAQRVESSPSPGYIVDAHPRCDYFILASVSAGRLVFRYVAGERPEPFVLTWDTLGATRVGTQLIEIQGRGVMEATIVESSLSRTGAQDFVARSCGFESYAEFLTDPSRGASGLSSSPPSVAPSPPSVQPGASLPRAPSNSDLQVRITSVDLSDQTTAYVRGRVCNYASDNWAARDVEVGFSYRDLDSFRWSASGTASVSEVRAGDCETFTRYLYTLNPIRSVSVDRVDWSWRRGD